MFERCTTARARPADTTSVVNVEVGLDVAQEQTTDDERYERDDDRVPEAATEAATGPRQGRGAQRSDRRPSHEHDARWLARSVWRPVATLLSSRIAKLKTRTTIHTDDAIVTGVRIYDELDLLATKHALSGPQTHERSLSRVQRIGVPQLPVEP